MKSPPIYLLIQSLDKTELGYLKKEFSTSRFKNRENLIKIIDSIAMMESAYSEEELEGESDYYKSLTIKKRNYWKSILYERILSVLGKQIESNKAEIELSIYKGKILSLIGKGLYDLARREIDKAIQYAEKHNLELEVLKVIQLRRNLILEESEIKRKVKSIGFYKNTFNNFLSNILIEFKLFDIYEEVFSDTSRSNQFYNKILDRLKAFQFEKEELPFNSYLYFHYSKSICLRGIGAYVEAGETYEKLKLLFDSNSSKKRSQQSRYLNFLNNYFNNASFPKVHAEKMEWTIAELRKISPIDQQMKLKKIQHLHYYDLIYFLVNRDYLKVVDLSFTIEKDLEKYGLEILPLKRRHVFFINIAAALLITKRFDHFSKWVNKILDSSKIEINILIRARLFQLIFFFDLSRTDLSKIDSAQKEILRIRRLIKAKNKNKNLDLIETSKKVNSSIQKSLGEYDNKKLLNNFVELNAFLDNKEYLVEFYDWVNARFDFSSS